MVFPDIRVEGARTLLAKHGQDAGLLAVKVSLANDPGMTTSPSVGHWFLTSDYVYKFS